MSAFIPNSAVQAYSTFAVMPDNATFMWQDTTSAATYTSASAVLDVA